jgi:DNA-binding MarR family transcriptional regulator
MDRPTLEIAANLRRSMARMNRRLRQETRGNGLSAAKHGVLGHLYRDGAQTAGTLADAEGVQPQSLTRVLAELEQSGHVLRRQDDADRRQFMLEITPAGRELIRREARQRAHWLAAGMESRLTAVERQVLQLAAQLFDRLCEAPQHDEAAANDQARPPRSGAQGADRT